MSGFLQSAKGVFGEAATRENLRDGVLKFGIQYLDDAMIGILKNDLILIGAGSGAGKTQTCVNIAKANVENGKRVHYIALEAEYLEIERRILYQLFAKHFFNDFKKPNINISFQNWMLGDFVRSCDAYEALAASEFMREFPTLFTYYKADKFDVEDLIMTVTQCASDTDLIILDHVHYMDFDDNNENRAIKEIAKTARTLALEMGKPIILVSHVRKSDRFSTAFAPSLEEFHGSSDLYKIATKAVTIGPGAVLKDGTIETYLRIVKNRFEGSVTRYVAKSFYNPKAGKYERKYQIGDAYQKRDDGFRQLTQDLYPKWGEYYAPVSGDPDSTSQEQQPPDEKYKRKTAFSISARKD